MANTAEIIVKVVDQSSAGLSKVNSQVNKFNRGMQQSNSLSGGLTSSILRLGAAIGTAFSVKAIINTTARFEDLRDTLTSVEGSAEGGAAAFAKIQNFATKTQFGVEDLTIAYIKLKTAGIEPTEELLTTFTDTAAVTTDQIGSLQAITDLLSRTTSGGLGLEELNRLADRGVPVFKILEETLNLTRLEISEFGKTAEGAKIITDALIAGLNKKFGGATQQRLDNLSVSMSNFGIAVTNSLDILGQGFAPQLTEVTNKLGEFIVRNEDTIRAIGEGLGNALMFVVDNFGLFATAIGTIAGLGFIKYIQNLTVAMKALALSNPFTAIATIAITAAYAIYDNWGTISKWFDGFFDKLKLGWLNIKKSIYSALDAAPFADFSKEVEDTEKAISDLEKEIIANAKATEENADATKGADKALSDLEKQIVNNTKDTKKLTGETGELGEKTEEVNEESDDYTKTVEKLRKQKDKLEQSTGKVTKAYQDYIETLEEENRLARLGNDEREIQIAITKGLEAAAKDLDKTVQQLTETERRQVEERVRGLILENQEIERNKKKQEETVSELEALYDDYHKTIIDYRDANLSNAEQYAQAVEKLETDLANGLKLTEKEKDEYLRALRSKYLEDYTAQAEEFRNSQLTDTQKYYQEIEQVEELYRAGAIQSEQEKAQIINGIRYKYSQQYIATAKNQANQELGIFGQYAEERKKLDEALNSGIITDYEVYLANRRKLDKDYADAAASEYSSLYGILEDKTKELTGLTDKEFGTMRDIVKLTFGVDVNDIIKGVFANGIGYLKTFVTGGLGEFGGFAGGTGSIFSGIAGVIDSTFLTDGLTSIGSFVVKGLDAIGGFGTGIFDILGGVGKWLLNNFSSIFDSISRGASSLLSSVSGLFGGGGRGGGGFWDNVISIGSTILGFLFADGGVIQNGQQVTKYANGGIVDQPTMFPMANGIGLMGEAGGEAIMPLTRVNGQLGVNASGLGNYGQTININFTVNTMDARDFDSLLVEKKQLITNIVSSAVRQGNRSFA